MSESYKLQQRIEQLEMTVRDLSGDLKLTVESQFRVKAQTVRMDHMHLGLCVDTADPYMQNRVRFYHPVLHEPDSQIHQLPWARPVSAAGGFDDSGMSWVPPAGSTLVMFFNNGNRDLPYYVGTAWSRSRGPGGSQFPVSIPEYKRFHAGHRKGYLVGPNDESQVLPPWNTESYNGKDIDSLKDFVEDPEAQKRLTIPHIYGMKTPQKAAWKVSDGDPKCNHRWKRMEFYSSCGNWMIFKDDHMHYGGQWSHKTCQPPGSHLDDVSLCSEHQGERPYFTDPYGKPIEGRSDCGEECEGGGETSCGKTIGGAPANPDRRQGGANPYFKHENECRPYKGPGTPQNNRCDLPQTGIQLLSISGHTMILNDAVEEPRGIPDWERSTKPFDFGCNDKYLGSFTIKSATGHRIKLNDKESETNLRGDENFIEAVTAAGNRIHMNDHTVGNGEGCPPDVAGPKRGIEIESTSKHGLTFCDHMNEQCSPARKEGGVPVAKATKAYVDLHSGYGLSFRMEDEASQQKTESQWMQLTHPQCAVSGEDEQCNEERGAHFLRFQGRPKGEPGIVFLRAGGHAIRQTYDADVVLVGDKEKNPSDKFTHVSRNFFTSAEETHFRYAGQLHVLMAEKYILLMAGRDCPPKAGKKCKVPCLYPVVIGRCGWRCPLTKQIHWTDLSLSERVFASGKSEKEVCGGGGDGIEQQGSTDPASLGFDQPCEEGASSLPPEVTEELGSGPS